LFPVSGANPGRQPVIAPGTGLLMKRHVPVCGDLMAGPEVTWAAIERLALRETEIMIEELAKAGFGGDVLAAYQWNMGLNGLTSVRVPLARTADGGEVGLADVLGELVRRSCVWVTRRSGSVEGAFPGSPPTFVLPDDNSPLLRVLRHRAPPGSIRELGGIEMGPAAASLRLESARAPDPTEPIYFCDLTDLKPLTSAMDPTVIVSEAAAPSAALAAVRVAPWLERLRLRVALLFATPSGSAKVMQQEQSALCAALHQALGELGLVGGPVHAIIEAKRGPAICYDKRNKRIILNRRHRALRWVRSSDAPSARALSFLIAAIVSEINRELTEVTDAEERRVLQQLLRTGIEGSGAA